jgi:ubiquinone/menaquinone biosynthesis C-methylase UbiE
LTEQPSSISFEPLAAVYDETRGGLERAEGFVRDLAPHLRGPRVVEVGIGTGAVALALQQVTGLRAIGVDISPAMLTRAVERIGRRVAIGDAGCLPFPDACADSVVAVWVLQLVPDIAAVLVELRRVVRPGGRLAIVLSQPEERLDDIAYLQRLLFERLGRRAGDGPHQVADLAGELGLPVVESGLTTEQEWDQTPAQAAERLEKRWYASLLGLDEARFAEVVLPIAAEMRALPDPLWPRRRASRHHYLVCERPAGL